MEGELPNVILLIRREIFGEQPYWGSHLYYMLEAIDLAWSVVQVKPFHKFSKMAYSCSDWNMTLSLKLIWVAHCTRHGWYCS